MTTRQPSDRSLPARHFCPSACASMFSRGRSFGPIALLGACLAVCATCVFADDVDQTRAETRHEIARIARILNRNFRPAPTGRSDRFKWVDGRRPFSGDCDDYAVAATIMVDRAGYKPRIFHTDVARDPNIHHVIACAETEPDLFWCLDSSSAAPLTYNELSANYPNWRYMRFAAGVVPARFQRMLNR